jgi:hypothetical protein
MDDRVGAPDAMDVDPALTSLKRHRSDSASSLVSSRPNSRARSQTAEMDAAVAVHAAYDATTAMKGHTPASRPSPAEQLEQIERLRSKPLAAGETWFIVPWLWYSQWKAACTPVELRDAKQTTPFECNELPPIDTSRLLSPDGTLREVPQEGIHAQFLPKEAWLLLEQWCAFDCPLCLLREAQTVGAGTA